MKLLSRAVAVGAVAALTLGTPTAAFAGGKSGQSSKGKTTSAQKSSGKAAEARKKGEERRKKAAEARSRFTFPGTVTAVSDGTVTLTRKVRGVTVNQQLVLGPTAELKRDGVRGAAPQVGDHAVAKGQKKDGAFVVRKLSSSAPEAAAAPAATTIAPGTVPATPTREEAPKRADGSVVI